MNKALLKDYLIARLKEPSTWRGLAMVAMALGISVQPDMMEQIIAVGTAAAGLVGMLTKG